MEASVKKEIKLMFIPLVGLWWVLGRVLPDLSPITWWDYSGKGLPTILAMCVYQVICFGLLKWVVG
jgi:hypothetical protein